MAAGAVLSMSCRVASVAKLRHHVQVEVTLGSFENRVGGVRVWCCCCSVSWCLCCVARCTLPNPRGIRPSWYHVASSSTMENVKLLQDYAMTLPSMYME